MLSLNGQDDAFAGLVAAKQFKQALNLCEKKLKKTKNDEYLQASAFIQEDMKSILRCLCVVFLGKEDHHIGPLARRSPSRTGS